MDDAPSIEPPLQQALKRCAQYVIMLDTNFINVHTAWLVTTKDKGDAYDKAMKLVHSLCNRDDCPTEARTTLSASQQVYTKQHLSALISYLVGCLQAKRPSRTKTGKE